MPRRTETTTLTDAIDSLEAERDRLAEEVAAIPEENRIETNDDYVDAVERGSEIDTHLAGLYWARDGAGDPDFDGYDGEEIVFGALTTGEHGHARGRLSDAKQDAIGMSDAELSGLDDIFFAATALEAAPFLDEDADFEDAVVAYRDLPPAFSSWVSKRAREVTSVGRREGNSFAALVQEKSQSKTPRETSKSSTPQQS